MSLSAGDLFDLVRTGAAGSRSDLRRLSGLSRTAVTARVAALADAGLVVLGEDQPSTGGRPATGVMLNAHAGVVLAAAVGRSRTQVAVFDLAGRELAAASLDHAQGTGPEEVLPPAVRRLAELGAEVSATRVLAVGVSLPGTVDPARGVSIDSPVMGGWDEVALAPYFAEVEAFAEAPLFVGNDADVLARSERMGHAQDHSDLLVVKASTGLGLGIIAEGRVVSGHRGAAGEIGHIIIDPENPQGRRELEHQSSRTAIARDICEAIENGEPSVLATAIKDGSPCTSSLIASALEQNDELTTRIVTTASEKVGRVVGSMVTMLSLERIVVGGGLVEVSGPFIVEPIQRAARQTCWPEELRTLEVHATKLGANAGLLGAALLAASRIGQGV